MSTFIHDSYTLTAIDLAREGKSFFITGKAGTGKTMLLKEIVKELKPSKQIAICAPTGVAAKNAGGVTIHSLLGLPITIYIPGHKQHGLYKLKPENQRVIESLDLLIVDEVSMVRCDVMDMMDDVLRHYRKNDKPFGGLQVILFGDLQQLMPVVTDEDWEKLEPYYKSAYFFSSNVIRKHPMPMLELSKVHRQKNNKFISLLNDVRDGKLNYEEEQSLKKLYNKDFQVSDERHYIRLTTHVSKAKRYNDEQLSLLKGKEHESWAYIKDVFPHDHYPTERLLKLKEKARVMFISNDSSGLYVNGTLGTVVRCEDDAVHVKTDSGHEVKVKKMTWEFYSYRINKVKKEVERYVIGTFRQFPLRLAWAITIHKSQGLTFDNVIIDAGKAFTYGQVYVALSRCRTLNGIVLTSKITPEIIKVDPIVTEYTQLVKRIWPEEENNIYVEEREEIDSFISKYNYKSVGHTFKAPWDGAFYDAWESATQFFYLEKLVENEGELQRLCVGEYKLDSLPFELLSLRRYDRIISFSYLGGKTSLVTCKDNDAERIYDFSGRICKSPQKMFVTGDPVINQKVIKRKYTYERNGDTLVICKESLSPSTPSSIVAYSDLGKLMLCCDCYTILRNDNHTYWVAVEDNSYKVFKYTLSGKALSNKAHIVADKWYQKNPDRAKFAKSYEKPTEKMATLKNETEIPKVNKETPKSAQRKVNAPSSSLETKILNCLKRYTELKARDISKHIDRPRNEINRLLHGELKHKGLVVQNGKYWKLAQDD